VIDLVRVHYPDPVPTPELLDRFGLGEVAGRRAGGLSGGQTGWLAVALAFAARACDPRQRLGRRACAMACNLIV
jgi:ABC-2 type transport system ATP-binding protein